MLSSNLEKKKVWKKEGGNFQNKEGNFAKKELKKIWKKREEKRKEILKIGGDTNYFQKPERLSEKSQRKHWNFKITEENMIKRETNLER